MLEMDRRVLFLVVPFALFSPIAVGDSVGASRDAYLRRRQSMLGDERSQRTGGSVVLSPDESRVNDSLMRWKLKEATMGQAVNGTFPPAVHFFRAKKLIDDSLVFRFIRRMPKGAALHGHDFALADMHWVIQQATYDNDCYMCFDKSNLPRFHFFKVPPPDKDCQWTSVLKLRALSGDPVKFDAELYRNLTLIVDDPDSAYPDEDAAWNRFQSLFRSLGGLLLYDPMLRKFVYEALREHYEDNVQYVEMRGILKQVYDLEGRVYDKEFLISLYQNTSNLFVKDHPDSLGLRFIPTSSRSAGNQSIILNDILNVIDLRKKFPGFIVGYDIVGQEDRGGSLLSYIDALLYPSQQGISLPYFLHAGETNFEDTSVDLNILDAVLLNSSRIGHGFAIMKHPAALKMIRDKNIAIEICPISNQVLGLVKDLRNHPAADLMAIGSPVTIGADDPGLWNATGLSYDFYEAFMGLGGMWADLATLKQLAINSILYSGLSYEEKTFTFDLWQKKWDSFIHEIATEI